MNTESKMENVFQEDNRRKSVRCLGFLMQPEGVRVVHCVDKKIFGVGKTEIEAIQDLHSKLKNFNTFTIRQKECFDINMNPIMEDLPKLWSRHNHREGNHLNSFYSHYIDSNGLNLQFKLIRVREREFSNYCRSNRR